MIIVLGLIIITIVLFILTSYFSRTIYDEAFAFSFLTGAFTLIASVIIIGVCIFGNITKEAYVAKEIQRYNSLVYQLENIDTLYGNSRANDRKELFNQIQEWNEDLANCRIKHNSAWTNWLYPVDYSQFEFIELK